jgi:hypothetical protein
VAPLNRLLALVNLFLRLIGKPVIPDLGSYGSDPSAALEPLDAAVRRLQHLRQTYFL